MKTLAIIGIFVGTILVLFSCFASAEDTVGQEPNAVGQESGGQVSGGQKPDTALPEIKLKGETFVGDDKSGDNRSGVQTTTTTVKPEYDTPVATQPVKTADAETSGEQPEKIKTNGGMTKIPNVPVTPNETGGSTVIRTPAGLYSSRTEVTYDFGSYNNMIFAINYSGEISQEEKDNTKMTTVKVGYLRDRSNRINNRFRTTVNNLRGTDKFDGNVSAPFENLKFYISMNSTDNNVELPNSATNAKETNSNRAGSCDVDFNLGNNMLLSTRIFGGVSALEYRGTTGFDSYATDVLIGGRATLATKILDNSPLTARVNFFIDRLDYRTDWNGNAVDFDVIFKRKFTNEIFLEAGLTGGYHRNYNYSDWVVSPVGEVTYAFGNDMKLKYYVNAGLDYPAFSKIFVEKDYVAVSDTVLYNIKSEKSVRTGLKYEYSFFDNSYVDVDVGFRNTWNYIALNPFGYNPSGYNDGDSDGLFMPVNLQNAYFVYAGVEAKVEFEYFSPYLRYDFTLAKSWTSGEVIPNVPMNTVKFGVLTGVRQWNVIIDPYIKYVGTKEGDYNGKYTSNHYALTGAKIAYDFKENWRFYGEAAYSLIGGDYEIMKGYFAPNMTWDLGLNLRF